MKIIMNCIVVIIICQTFYHTCESRLIWANDIKITSDDIDADLEQIPSKLLASLGLLVDQGKLEQFDSIINSQPKVGKEYQDVPLKEYDYEIDYDAVDERNSRKRLANGKIDYDSTVTSFINGTATELDYNLNEFKKDYNIIPEPPNIATALPLKNTSVTPAADDRSFIQTPTLSYSQSCLEMSLWKYIFFGIPCLVRETLDIRSTGKLSNAAIFLGKTLQVYIPVFLFIITILWCYNGMCGCLCPLDFFNPYKGIIKIKNQAYENPPGVYFDADGNKMTYEPSEEEIRVYDELLKLIRS